MKEASRSVALIPGFMLDETLWDAMIDHLPETWTVIHSSLGNGKTIGDMAAQIAATLPPTLVLIGFSLGGYVARQLAADYPDRVQALILIASSLRADTHQQMQSKQQALQAVSPSTFVGLSRGSIAQSLNPLNVTDDALIAQIRAMSKRLGYDALVTQSTLQRAGVPTTTIRCPTLVVASSNDRLRSLDEAKELVEDIPNASLHVVDHSGHMIPLEQPEELADIIVRWLSQQHIE